MSSTHKQLKFNRLKFGSEFVLYAESNYKRANTVKEVKRLYMIFQNLIRFDSWIIVAQFSQYALQLCLWMPIINSTRAAQPAQVISR